MKKTRVTGKMYGEIDCKRFYMPGVELMALCPKCGAGCGILYDTQYLSYPVANEWTTETLVCPDCEPHFEFPVKIRLKVELEVKP